MKTVEDTRPKTVVESAYDADPAYEWHRLERHRIEFEITRRALAEHLPPAPARIADVGGGPGRYAIALASRGYPVTLVDLSSGCLEFARARAAETGVTLTDFVHADAVDLSRFASNSFDAVLLMGPLYHLIEPAQRAAAVAEAARILRPGGIVAASFITRYAIIQYAAAKRPDYFHACAAEWASIRDHGFFRITGGGGRGFPDAWFAHPADIQPLMQPYFQQRALLAAEPLVNNMEDNINACPPELFATWMQTLYPIAGDPSILGAAAHLLYVGTRR